MNESENNERIDALEKKLQEHHRSITTLTVLIVMLAINAYLLQNKVATSLEVIGGCIQTIADILSKY